MYNNSQIKIDEDDINIFSFLSFFIQFQFNEMHQKQNKYNVIILKGLFTYLKIHTWAYWLIY